MEPLVSTQVLGDIDERAMREYAIPSLLLMEHAGVKGFHRLLEISGKPMMPDTSLVVIAGSGNNGGDALVMAREAHLMGKKDIRILYLGTRLSQSCAVHRDIISKTGIAVHEVSLREEELDETSVSILRGADVIIDGILGTGLHSKVNDVTSRVIHLINEQKERDALIVSVDVPSGYSDQLPATMAHVKADITITFGLEKYGACLPAWSGSWGKIVVVNPSFPPKLLSDATQSARLADFSDITIPGFTHQDYKNSRGHVAVFGGSPTYTGAVQLTSYAAFSSGTGLISLFLDEEVASSIRQDHPSFIVHTVDPLTPYPSSSLTDYQAILCGPGWGENREHQLHEVLKGDIPVVLDADAIQAFGSLLHQKRIVPAELPPLILTPHPGELRTLLEQLNMPLYAQDTGGGSTPEAFLEALKSISKTLNAVLVYKTHMVWIADGRKDKPSLTVVKGNNNSLGVAGSGDVLTGIIGSCVAGGLPVEQAALSGVLLHQRAGELARDEQRWYDSNRLISYIPAAYEQVEKEQRK